MAGMLAETCACIVYVPVDVVKERLQVQRGNEAGEMLYRGSYDAFQKILKHEGLGGIYKGYIATLASFGPFSALYFVFYERLKELSRNNSRMQSLGDNQNIPCPNQAPLEIPFHHTVLDSALAGAAASWLTSPLDLAKLRLQIQRGMGPFPGSCSLSHSDGNKQYRGIIDCLIHIYKEQGFRGLFRGAGARVIHYVPAITVTMTCYEEFRRLLSRER
jgi:hypothetical protein